MAVDKKDFDIDPGSGVSAAPAEEAAAEGSDAQPRRKKRTGLRVPSDNVPRPDGRTGRTMPPGEVAAAPPPPVEMPGVVTILPQRPPSAGPGVLPAATPPPHESGVSVRAHTEDLEVDVELIEDDSGVMAPAVNGSGPHARGATVVNHRLHHDDDDGGDETQDEVSDGVPASVTHELSWNPPAEPGSELEAASTTEMPPMLDDMAAEPTVIGPPPTGFIVPPPTPASAAPAPTGTAPPPRMSSPSPAAAAAVPTPAPSMDSGPTVMFTPAPTPVARAESSAPVHAEAEDEEPASAVASEDAEELSPTELEEVESGPTPSPSVMPRAASVQPRAASAPSDVAAAAPAQPMSAAAALSPPSTQAASAAMSPVPTPAAGTPSGPRVSVPPPPPPAPPAAAQAVVAKAPPPPPAPKAAAAAAAATAAAAAAQPKSSKKRKGKAWFEEIFDEDYLRTLPFLTPQATQREAAFIAESLGIKPGMQVLDLGCGYGRHAMELAARGHHVVGLDLSLPLLIRGADEAQRRGLNINFVHGDMRELTFDAQFDGAYCVFSTFGYFDDETNKRVAVNLARALKPGAKLVIDVLNRDYVIADLPTRVWWEGDGCVVLEEVDFNYFTSRVISNRSVVFEDGRQLEQEISMRSYSLHELGKLLHTAGFKVTEVSGGLATRGRFFGNESRQIIVVAEKRAEGGATSGGNTPTSPPPVDSK